MGDEAPEEATGAGITGIPAEKGLEIAISELEDGFKKQSL